jgi:hypothetical protein
MDHCFQKLIDIVALPEDDNEDYDDSPSNDEIYKIGHNKHSNNDIISDSPSTKELAVLRVALELFYIWVHFSPLTRGTAACAYAGLMSIMISFGYVFSEPLPLNKQLDWEAIFSINSTEFIDNILPLLPLVKSSIHGSKEFKNSIVQNDIGTLRHMIHALN